MAELILTVFLDGLMALLLIMTTVYCWRLNKRIRVLQDSKSDLANIISQFDTATQRATKSISEIHEASARIAENMQHKIDKANYIADDLQFMIEKSNKIADRMDGGIATNRPATPSPKSRAMDDAAELSNRKPAQNRGSAVFIDEETEAEEAIKSKNRSSIESVLRRAKEKRAEAPAEEDDGKRRRQGARLRSKAEQELFEALKTGSKG